MSVHIPRRVSLTCRSGAGNPCKHEGARVHWTPLKSGEPLSGGWRADKPGGAAGTDDRRARDRHPL